MIQGVLFDMDGVVFDSERATSRIMTASAVALGYPYTPESFLMVLGTNEQATREIYRRAFGDAFPERELHHTAVARLTALAEAGELPYKPGFEECIQGLRKRGVRTALATSTGRDLVEVYRKAYPAFQNAFDATVCGMEVPRSKPSPDIYLLAAQKLGLKPEDCLGVEDSYNGLKSLRAAGVISVMIPDLLPYTQAIAPQVDHLLANLTRLCPLIDQLNARS